MRLYSDAAVLCGVVLFLTFPASRWLAGAGWVSRAPRAAVALWQSIGLSAALAAIAAGLCVATERYHAGFAGGVAHLVVGIIGGHPLAGLGLPDALGLTLVVDLGVVLTFVVGAVMLRTARARAHHRRLLAVLATHWTAPTGTVMLDSLSPVAYCLPGIRPRIVISAGTMRLLTHGQLAAVIAHEQGHAHERHGMVLLPMTGLPELFGWIPYARLAPAAMAGLLEMAADDHAARSHAPGCLASALVVLSTAGAVPSCALGVNGRDVHRRVMRLLDAHRVSKGRASVAGALAVAALAAPLLILTS